MNVVQSCALPVAAGASASVHVVTTTDKTECPNLHNAATFTTSNDGSGGAQADIAVNCGDVSMAKIADASSVSAGDQAGFTVSVSNNGTGNAYDVTATDNLPGGTVWSISGPANGWAVSSNVLTYGPATLAAGASATAHVGTTTARTDCPNLHNAATFTTSNDGSGGAQADIAVNCGDVSMAKIADASSFSAGDQARFTVPSSPTRPSSDFDVTATDNLPGGTVWSISGPANGWAVSSNVLTYGPATLAAG